MSALDIQPHSRHGSTLAVALLSLLAVGAFVAGLNNQLIGSRGLPPFPTASASQASHPADAIPEATPTPDTRLADAAAAAARRAARPLPVPEEVTPEVAAPSVATETQPAVEAVATATVTAPDPAPAGPAPAAAPAPPVPDTTTPPT